MNNLRNLKDKGYNGISIAEDHTIMERKMIKDFAEKAQSANDNEACDFEKNWVFRGSPKMVFFSRK